MTGLEVTVSFWEYFGHQASSPQRCSHVLLDFLEAAVIAMLKKHVTLW
jgi:hypothetical protein